MTNHPITHSSNRTIPDRWLPVVWVGWLIYVLVVFTIHVEGTPLYLAQLQAPDSLTVGAWERPTLGDAAVLPQLGISLPWYAHYITAWALIYGVTLFGAGLFIFWRRPYEVMAIIVSLTLISDSLGENSIDYLLEQTHPWWAWPVEFNQMTGAVLLLWIGYLFPNGRLVPPWSKWLMIAWGVMNFFWFLFPAIPLNHLYGETAERHLLATFLLITGCYLTGLYAQIYRYRYVSTFEERAQTRWVLLGFGANFISTTVRFLPLAIAPLLNEPGLPRLIHILLGFPLANLAGMVTPITLTIALLRYRLWLVDPILNRAMVYTLLTAVLTGIYLFSLYVVQWLLPEWAIPTSAVDIFVATAAAALLLAPIRNGLQRAIDRTFQRARIDVQSAFSTLQQEIRTLITLPALLERLVVRLTDLLHATHGVIYLADETEALMPAQGHGLFAKELPPLALGPPQRQRLEDGVAVITHTDPLHLLLVPLPAPPTEKATALMGVLALGRRQNGQPYSRDDLVLLATLGAQAGAAIAVARLVAEEQARLAWRNSAAGQAAALAAELPTTPQALLPQLHALAIRAHTDLEAANVLRHLADAFQAHDNNVAATLAQGYYFLATGHREPALLTIGLRTLVTELNDVSPTTWPAATALAKPLALFLAALQAETLQQIMATVLPADQLPAESASLEDAGAELRLAQQQLQRAVAGLAAYGQVETADEQLGLLVQTLDRLTSLAHRTAAQLSPPIRTLVQRIAEHWRALLTRQAAALRRQARIVAVLITRRLFVPETTPDTDEPAAITLLLALTNQGRGQAVELVITLTVPLLGDHKVASEVLVEQQLARLIAGETVQVAFTLQPWTIAQLPLHFTIRYQDEEGMAQQLIYRDELRLLPTNALFQPIPNPYVAGAPLRPQSATFVGRQSDLQFIRDTLRSVESNVAIVLTGERRMGKTSLLQQLLVQLRNDYAPVYLDCQALGIEPGLGRFLYDVAEAVAAAAELPRPNAADFADRPSAFFERTFLPQVQQALGQRRLVLLFDEFEELQARVDRGRLEPELFPYLRHLIQHSGLEGGTRFAVLFAGTHRLHELNPAYWSAFFNVAHHRRLTHLHIDDARHLITIPVTPHLHYDDLALAQMLRLTGGHPYFLQLLCYVIVNTANHEERGYVSLAQVQAALTETFDLAASHLLYLWGQVDAAAQPVLLAAAAAGRDGASFDMDAVYGHIAQTTAVLAPATVAQILQELVTQEVLQSLPTDERRYRFSLELLRLWIERRGRVL
ncbi:MAG: AAA-like domain-containing protein [Caldilineaceae bacterium]